MKKLLLPILSLFLVQLAFAQIQYTYKVTGTSPTVIQIFFRPTTNFVPISGINTAGLCLRVDKTIFPGTTTTATNALFTWVSQLPDLPSTGGSTVSDATGSPNYWVVRRAFSGFNTATAGTTFIAGTEYPFATVTVNSSIPLSAISAADYSNNQVGGTGPTTNGTYMSVDGTNADDNAALFYDYPGTTISSTASNGGSVLSVSTITFATILPVSITSFTGTATGCTANLAWATASENNSKYYAVEASLNGSSFTQVGTVKSNNSATGGNYSFAYGLNGSTNFFRLKMVDLDGKYAYSSVVAVSGTGACSTGLKVTVAPNPATNLVNVQGITVGSHVALIDAGGKKLTEVIATSTNETINVAKYAKGIYMLRVENADGSMNTMKVVKQ